jgi:tRNAThr (cytosine32-N3)-methyltransferase
MTMPAADMTTNMNNLLLDSSGADAELPTPPSSSTTPPHLSHDPLTNTKRTDPFQFGQRFLSESDDVFAYNAWDHVTPDPSHDAYCESQYMFQRSSPVSAFDKTRFNNAPEKWWDLFYKQKSATFFKDRKWLFQEFPILHDATRADAGHKVILEVGAGAGNTAFPILRQNENAQLALHAYDFSKKAVETMRASPDYDTAHMRAEVWDVASQDSLPPGLLDNSVDVVIMIFIFSALSPTQWMQAVRNIHRVLKPGGEVLFRDYGRGDLAQVRFKGGRWMEENFYVRGDGTRVYFFELDELRRIWAAEQREDEQSAESGEESVGSQREVEAEGKTPRFEILNLDVDRRLIVNRQRRIKMYRCWIQGRFRKPIEADSLDIDSSST